METKVESLLEVLIVEFKTFALLDLKKINSSKKIISASLAEVKNKVMDYKYVPFLKLYVQGVYLFLMFILNNRSES